MGLSVAGAYPRSLFCVSKKMGLSAGKDWVRGVGGVKQPFANVVQNRCS